MTTTAHTTTTVGDLLALCERIGVDYHHYDLAATVAELEPVHAMARAEAANTEEAEDALTVDDATRCEYLDQNARSDRAPYLFDLGLY